MIASIIGGDLIVDRFALLESLVTLSEPLNELADKVGKLDWDYEGNGYSVSADQISIVIKRAIDGKISFNEIEDWANLIECREDLEFEVTKKNEIGEAIHKLANPILEGPITNELCAQLVIRLS